MPNPFTSKPGSKKLNDPYSMCPLAKAQIRIEVYGFDPRNPGNRQAIEGVGLTVSGPTPTVPSKTAANGKWRYQPLDPGPYTVTPEFPPDLDERHDVTGAVAQQRNLAETDDKTVVFLVPTTWVEFVVKDTANQTLSNIGWQLARRPAAGAAIIQYDTGNTGEDGKVFRQRVLTGTHQFTVKTLSDPQWSAAEAVIGVEMALSAKADGCAKGDAGTIEIVDACDIRNVLQTVPASVNVLPAGTRLEGKWKPVEQAFTNLKHSRIVFRAKVASAMVYSEPVCLLKPETLKFEDSKGKVVDREVQLFFSSGSKKTATTVKGTADTRIPWGETLMGVKMPGLAAARVKIDAGASSGGVAV